MGLMPRVAGAGGATLARLGGTAIAPSTSGGETGPSVGRCDSNPSIGGGGETAAASIGGKCRRALG